jgi:type I restriction enzyme S subunit
LGKLIEKKRNIKQGAIQELLGMRNEECGMRNVPRRRLAGFSGAWVEKRLGDCGFCFNGLTGKSGSDFGHGKACYITFLNVLTNVVIDSSIFEPVDICSGENQNEVRRGDIFFNTSSETPEEVGLCAVLEEDVKSVYLNSFCFGFRITDNDVSGRFLAYWFRASAGRALMTSLAQGSTRYNLSKDAFREACVCIPPTLAEQRAIATVLSDMDAEIAALEAKRAKYESIKQGMMQELLTGKTRLKGA